MSCQSAWLESPVGPLLLEEEDEALVRLAFLEQPPVDSCSPSPLLEVAKRQLSEYFRGARQHFDLPLKPSGTPFQQKAWQALQQIPYGETRSYQQQALAFGGAQYARAVGSANGRNPIAIIIPCHRVIGKNGALTGFAGGMDRKHLLLQLEARFR